MMSQQRGGPSGNPFQLVGSVSLRGQPFQRKKTEVIRLVDTSGLPKRSRYQEEYQRSLRDSEFYFIYANQTLPRRRSQGAIPSGGHMHRTGELRYQVAYQRSFKIHSSTVEVYKNVKPIAIP